MLVAMFGGWRPAQVYAQSAVTYTSLIEFTVTNGSLGGGLFRGSEGKLYGTTSGGLGIYSNGTIFSVTTNGLLTTLFLFNGTNGSSPRGNVVQGSDGAFYGATAHGGSNDVGTVYKFTTNGVLTTLVEFNNTNGAYPARGLCLGNDGAFYGTTAGGGTNHGDYNGGAGTIFRITTDGTFTSLFSFNNTNGNQPVATLTLASDGNFYGTTYGGGATFSSNSDGNGTVFKFALDGKLTTLFSFNSNNGAEPQAGMIQGKDGALYGTTAEGGTYGCGTIFKISTNGDFSSLFSFAGTNGATLFDGLVEGSDGAFYGMASGGGTGYGFGLGAGTIYRLTTNGAFSKLFDFNNANGYLPLGTLMPAGNGVYYGTASQGGTYNEGAIFRFSVCPPVSATIQANNTILLSWMALNGRSYQVQCKSGLTQSNWVNFGSPVTATDTTMTVSDTIASGVGQKLYRVALLP